MTDEREHILKEGFPVFRHTAFYCGDGWFPLLSDLGLHLDGLPFDVVECKEKFGGLRVHYAPHEDVEVIEAQYQAVAAAVLEAERRSFVTCEACGAPGIRIQAGWLYVRCATCASAMYAALQRPLEA